MKKSITTIFGAAIISLPVMAMAQGLADMDANGDGMLSLDEVQAVHADVTGDAFAAADTNADGMLDEAELTAGQESGALPANTDG